MPSVVVPFFGDQPYWGQRVADLGVGPARSPQEADGGAAGAGDSNRGDGSGDAPTRADLGAQIRAEDGVARAVAVVEQMAR